MSNFSTLFNLQTQLGLLMALGFLLSKIRIIDATGRRVLTDLIIDVILPCNIICSFQIAFNREIFLNTISILLVSVLVQIVSVIVNQFAYRHYEHSKRSVLQYGTICSNAGFLGNPIAEGIFGSNGLLLASIFLIPLRIVMWSLGLNYFMADGTAKTPEQKRQHRKDTLRKILTHPCIIAAEVGMLIMLFQIKLPSFLGSTLKSISNGNTAFSMILIGAIIGGSDIGNPLNKDVLYYCSIRLIGIPAVIWAFCHFAHIAPLSAGVAIILTAMPMGGTTSILASKYGADSSFAAKCTAVSTILSLLTTPLWCLFV